MRLGFLTKFSEDEVALAARIGFNGLEAHVSSWPPEALASKRAQEKTADEAGAIMDRYGVSISALALYDTGWLTKPLKQVRAEFGRALAFCNAMNVKVLATLAGRIGDKSVEENLPVFRKVFGMVARIAAERGVRIALENWPGMLGYPISGKNLAYSPQVWEMMFEAVASEALGLEFDPSHLYWQGIDHIAALRKFADRVYHVHAKDTELREDVLSEVGLYGRGWWRYVIPGLGRIDWAEFISTLRQVGYDGGIAIEHEDRVYYGERRAEGLGIGYKHLAQFLAL